MTDEDIADRLYRAVREVRRRNLRPTAVYLGSHEYTLLRASDWLARGFIGVRRGDEPETVLGIPLFLVAAANHFAVHSEP